MYPWRSAGKFLQEFGGRDHSRISSAGVRDIRNRALDEIAIFIIQRHLPHFFAHAFGSRQK